MWHHQASTITTAAPEAVWALWSDVSTWKDWDPGLENVKLNGLFAVGTKGKLKPTGGPTFSFTLTEVTPNQSFSDVTKLPLARLRAIHSLSQNDNDELVITHRIEIDGLLKPLFSRLIGKGIVKDLATTIHQLAKAAEKKSKV